ncbi:MAG: hypothetical protein K6C41_00435 [Lachnospiraceae bacterium]|nr:hypothetical protein [Lachnospiraceae bacterium]
MYRLFVVPEDARQIYADLLPDDIRDEEDLLIVAGEVQVGKKMECAGISTYTPLIKGAWELTFIHVAQEFSRQGIARGMLDYAGNLIGSYGGDMLIAAYPETDETAGLSKCLEGAHFTASRNGALIKQSTLGKFRKGIDALPEVGRFEAVPLSEADDELWKDLQDTIDEEGETKEEGVFPLLHDRGDYQPTVSMICTGDYERVKGAILFEDIDGIVYISYLFAARESTGVISDLLKSALKAAEELYDDDIVMSWHSVNPLADQIAERLLEGAGEIRAATVAYERKL